jgi:tetratricopeptide (TPR) repeat protein/TolB-like protein
MTRRLVLALCVLLSGAPARAQQPPVSRVLVVPFENAAHEPRHQWLGEACAVLLEDELAARGVAAITRRERVRAFDELHLPFNASLTRATVIKVGEIVGASEVIVGSFRVQESELVATAQTIRLEAGRVAPDAVERGPLGDFFAIFERLASRVSPAARPPSSSPAGSRPPLGAFENFIKGLVAESAATKATFLESAIREYPSFDRARLALWDVRNEQGDHETALATVKAVPASSRLAPRARFLGAVSMLALKQYDEAFGAFKQLLDELPADRQSPVLNNLGVALIRRGATPQTGTPVYFLTKAADAAPSDPDYQFNLGYAYALDRNFPGAIYWLREALRRDPTDPDAHMVLAAALQATGSATEAARERELAEQLSSKYEQVDRRAASETGAVPKGLERLRLDLNGDRTARGEPSLATSAQRDQRELATFHLDRGRRLFEREQDREALDELRRAVYLSPYEAQAHLLIGRIHLRGGRPREAIDALKISIWSADTAAARIALAEAYLKIANSSAARRELQRALELDPASTEASKLLESIK